MIFYYLNAEHRWVTINEITQYDLTDKFVAQTAPSHTYGVEWSPELDLFCAVGPSVCMTSPDGEAWTSRVVPAGAWYGPSWSPELSLFASVSSTGAAMYSSNGILWALGTIGAGQWVAVAWSPELGMFAAINYVAGNIIATSTDGINWTTQTAPVGAGVNWKSIAWSPELSLFVAVSQGGKTMYSSNGVLWTLGTIDAGSWNGICWSPELGIFVAVSAATNYVATSADGITFTSGIATATLWIDVVWTGELGYFIAVANNIAMISEDGITWTDATSVPSGSWIAVAWSPELSLAAIVSGSGTYSVMTAPS